MSDPRPDSKIVQEVRRYTRKFLKGVWSEVKINNSRFKHNEVVENLLSTPPQNIENYFNSFALQARLKSPFVRFLEIDQVYIGYVTEKQEAWKYILGCDLLYPDHIFMPTNKELKDSYFFYQSLKSNNKYVYCTFDDWVRVSVENMLMKLYKYKDILENPICLWNQVFLDKDKGDFFRRQCLSQTERNIINIKDRIDFLITKKAPAYLILVEGDKLASEQKIASEFRRKIYR